jgi:hypothetical protein
VLTQTIPFPVVPCVEGKVFAGVDEPDAELAFKDVGGGGAGAGAGTLDADWVAGTGGGIAAALPTVTRELILPIVDAETPAFDKSFTEEYGRPETIFFAVASPMPGKSFSSAALALFRSTNPPGDFDVVALDAVGFAADDGLLVAGLTGAEAAAPTETSGVIFLIVAAETPAFDKSSAEEYGRPAIIFLAVAVPTPGKLSNSFSLALFRSTFVLVAPACSLYAAPGCACNPSENARSIMRRLTTIARRVSSFVVFFIAVLRKVSVSAGGHAARPPSPLRAATRSISSAIRWSALDLSHSVGAKPNQSGA